MFRYPTFIVIAGLLGIAFGLPLLIAPRSILALNGAQTDTTGLWMARPIPRTKQIMWWQSDPDLDPVRDHPRYKRLVERTMVG
jgi:hypothetical protein